MRENLIPAQITDKNGHLTTRWVKPGNDGAAAAAKMPAPALSPAAPEVDYRAEINGLLRETVMQYGDSPQKSIGEASEHILAYIHENLLDESKPDYFKGEVSCLLTDHTEEYVMEAFLHLYDFYDGKLDDMEGVAFLRGALDSGSNAPKGYDRNDPARAESIKNLFRFIHETDTLVYTKDTLVAGVTNNTHFPANSTRIEDDHIADYIIDNGSQIDQIIAIANEHPGDIDDILKVARSHPEKLEAIKNLYVNHPERVEDRSTSDVSAILEELISRTPVNEGSL